MNQPQSPGVATAYQSQNLDHLGLVAGMCQALERATIIDAPIPSQAPDQVVSYGQAPVAMILNGLGFSTKALDMVPTFVEEKPVDRLLGQGMAPDHRNDDALGRTLEALYPDGVTPLCSRISQPAARMVGRSSTAAPLAATSFQVDGPYHHAKPPQDEAKVIHITKGQSRDHRRDLTHVGVHRSCESQAAIPVCRPAASGHPSAKTDVRRLMAPHVLPRSKQLGVEDIVADAALYTAKPREMLGAHTPLIPSGAATLHEAKEAIFKVPPDERMAIDDADSEQAVSSNDAGGRQRWLIMRREQASRRAHRTVSKQSGRDTENDYPQFHKVKSREFACAEDALNAGRPWPAMFTDGQRRDLTADAVKKDANRGKPSAKTPVPQMVYRLAGVLAWSIGTIRAVAKKLGGVLLATNELDATRLPAQEVLVLSKGPSKRERGVTFLKRPDVLAASFFVKPPERLAAVVMIMT